MKYYSFLPVKKIEKQGKLPTLIQVFYTVKLAYGNALAGNLQDGTDIWKNTYIFPNFTPI